MKARVGSGEVIRQREREGQVLEISRQPGRSRAWLGFVNGAVQCEEREGAWMTGVQWVTAGLLSEE